MTNKEYEEKLNSIMEKIGDDSANLILDDIAILLQDNKNMNDNLKNKDETIQKLEKKTENLQIVNGNLLQQVAMGEEPKKEIQEDYKPSIIDLRSVFDEKRKF